MIIHFYFPEKYLEFIVTEAKHYLHATLICITEKIYICFVLVNLNSDLHY